MVSPQTDSTPRVPQRLIKEQRGVLVVVVCIHGGHARCGPGCFEADNPAVMTLCGGSPLGPAMDVVVAVVDVPLESWQHDLYAYQRHAAVEDIRTT